MGQGHPLGTTEIPREADDRPAGQTRRSQASQPAALPRVPVKEELRLLYRLKDPTLAPAHLDAWLTWASRSRLQPFVKLARTIRRHRAAIRLGLNNGRLEGLNSRIRLISHRSFGFHSADPVIALFYLCCTGIVIPLPR